MVVSPHNQTPVIGIASVARFLCREYRPDLYESLGSLEQSAQIDSWLDALTGSLLHGGSKEKTSVMRRLNSHLGSSPFLAGDRVSLADIVGYAVVCNDSEQKVSGNVKLWLRRCQKIPEFSSVPCSCLVDT